MRVCDNGKTNTNTNNNKDNSNNNNSTNKSPSKAVQRRMRRRRGSPLGTIPGKNYQGIDPLSQTFKLDEDGAFLTSVDLFFARKDPNENISVEIRTTELGTPTNLLVQDYAEITLEPSEIK